VAAEANARIFRIWPAPCPPSTRRSRSSRRARANPPHTSATADDRVQQELKRLDKSGGAPAGGGIAAVPFGVLVRDDRCSNICAPILHILLSPYKTLNVCSRGARRYPQGREEAQGRALRLRAAAPGRPRHRRRRPPPRVARIPESIAQRNDTTCTHTHTSTPSAAVRLPALPLAREQVLGLHAGHEYMRPTHAERPQHAPFLS
jgi:hypothetical protein